MNILKFNLSVLYTKTELSPYSENDLIIEEYFKMFGEEVTDEEIANMNWEILNDNQQMYVGELQEIPDDYELR